MYWKLSYYWQQSDLTYSQNINIRKYYLCFKINGQERLLASSITENILRFYINMKQYEISIIIVMKMKSVSLSLNIIHCLKLCS
jgi:hypothetical protein